MRKNKKRICGFLRKYLCVASRQPTSADIYRQTVVLCRCPLWSGGCHAIRLACELFSLLFQHDLLWLGAWVWWFVCPIFDLINPGFTASWVFRWYTMLNLSLHFWYFWSSSPNGTLLTLHSCLVFLFPLFHLNALRTDSGVDRRVIRLATIITVARNECIYITVHLKEKSSRLQKLSQLFPVTQFCQEKKNKDVDKEVFFHCFLAQLMHSWGLGMYWTLYMLKIVLLVLQHE